MIDRAQSAEARYAASPLRRRQLLHGGKRNVLRLTTRLHLPTIVFLLLVLALWASLSQRFGAYLLPSPERVWRALGQIVTGGELWPHVFASLRRIGLGFGLACLVALLLGFCAARLPLLDVVVRDIAAILNSTSVFVWIVLAMIWFGLTDAAPSFTTLMVTLPIILSNVLEGIASVDPKLLEMARVHRLGALDRFFQITVPSTGPFLIAGMRSGFALGLRVSVVAEIFGVTTGIGYMMNLSRDTLRTDLMFAWSLVLIAAMAVVDRLVFATLARRVNRWR